MSDLRNAFILKTALFAVKVVHLEETLQTILAQREYMPAVQSLLGEMLSNRLAGKRLKSVAYQPTNSNQWHIQMGNGGMQPFR